MVLERELARGRRLSLSTANSGARYVFMGLMCLFILAGMIFLVWRFLKWRKKQMEKQEAAAKPEGTQHKRGSVFSKMKQKKHERDKERPNLV